MASPAANEATQPRLGGDAAPLGKQIPGYRLLQRIGKGASGSVFRATQLSVGRTVAIKVFDPRKPSPSAQQRFVREARLLARVRDPHIARVIEAGEAAGQSFIVLEFLDGPSLGEELATRGPLPEHEVRDLLWQIGQALRELQREGIVHRDIKPDNLLRRDDGRVTLCDFGLASDPHADARLTRSGVSMGTPWYMSPESICNALASDTRSDLYSLGATAYHLLCGQPPYTASSLTELALRQKAGPPPDPCGLRPDLTPELGELLLRLLAYQPEARPEDAEALCAELASLTAPPSTVVEPPPASTAPRWLLAVAIAMLCGLTGAVLSWRARETPSTAPAAESTAAAPGPFLNLEVSRGLYDFQGIFEERETRLMRFAIWKWTDPASVSDWRTPAEGTSPEQDSTGLISPHLHTNFALLQPRRLVANLHGEGQLELELLSLTGERLTLALVGRTASLSSGSWHEDVQSSLGRSQLPLSGAQLRHGYQLDVYFPPRGKRVFVRLRAGERRPERFDVEGAVGWPLPFALDEVQLRVAHKGLVVEGLGVGAEAFRQLPELHADSSLTRD